MAGGRFITLEGPDGSGKTSQAARLAAGLRALGHDVVLTREPGGTVVGDRIRDILMAPDGRMSPATDVLLFNAARAEHVTEIVRPSLAAGRSVVCARYADSTLAYQGYGSGQSIETLRTVIAYATGGLVPDLTILLDLPAEAGLLRKPQDDHTRFEVAFDLEYHRRVRAGFLELAAGDQERWVVIDADRDADAVYADVLAAALGLFERGASPA